jgi:hypothetical protein
VPPEQPKGKERPEKPQEADAVVQLLQRSSKTAGLPTPPNVERYDNGWLYLARLYQKELQALLPSPLLEQDLVTGLTRLADENLRQPLNWLMLLMSKPLTRHLASLVWECAAARPKIYTPAERFDHLAVTPFFLLPPPRSTSVLCDSVGRLTQERHPEVLTPEVGILGEVDGWWVDLRKLQPEALAALRSDWLATAPPCESPKHHIDTITLYCPLVEVEKLEEEGEADEIHHQARAFFMT